MNNNIVMIPSASLDHHPNNPRTDLGDLTELADSIRKSGIMQNLTVVKAPEGAEAQYLVVIGNRRLEAGRKAGIDMFPCVVAEMDEREQLATMMAENMQRQDLTVYDQIQGIGYMQQLGMSLPEIAEGTGLSESTVRKRASLVKLPKKQLFTACDKGATLLDLLEVTKLKSEKAQEKVLASFGTANFRYSINQEVRNEEIKAWRAEILPKIKALYPKLKNVPDTERYNNHYREVYRSAYNENSDLDIPEPEKGEKYGLVDVDWMIILMKEDKDWVQQRAEKKDKDAWMKDRKAEAKALNREAFDLRASFVRKFSLRSQKETVEFYDLLMSEAAKWRAYTHGVGSYHGSWNAVSIREMLAIPYEEGRNTEEPFMHELERRGIRKEAFALAWALCGGVSGDVYPDEGYISNYSGFYSQNDFLDSQYRILTALGYEMSDFEKALQNGTHEFFTKKVEV